MNEQQIVTETVEEIIFLIDELELKYQNSSMEEWKAWKHIRNTIRDRFNVQANYTEIHRKFGGEVDRTQKRIN